MNRDFMIEAIKEVRPGTFKRISYKTELPLKAEFKKQGYRIYKIVETTARFGINYNNIKTVIDRRAEQQDTVRRNVTNNYEWVVRNRVKHNNNTNKDYLCVASLPKGHNTKVRYIVEGTFVGTIDMGDVLDGPYKNLVIDSYFKPSTSGNEIKTISFDNIITIGNYKF